MQLVIDRKTWLRGEGTAFSSLLRSSDNKMCCVGFYCSALGISRRSLREQTWPTVNSGIQLPKSAEWLRDFDGPKMELARTNDSTSLSDAEREPKIAEIFARHGVEVEFVN